MSIMRKMSEKKKNIKQLTKAFWALTRQRQESFLKELYNLSNQNKSLFQIRLGNDDQLVMKILKIELEKQTINRIGKFKKLRLSKINETLRNADKLALNMQQKTELKRVAAFGMLSFILSLRYLPDRYEAATARQLNAYLDMVNLHILEKSEKEEIFAREKKILMKIIEKGYYLPMIEDVYLRYFISK